jgi:hypothetical protein
METRRMTRSIKFENIGMGAVQVCNRNDVTNG